jgi:hypothetical protein
MPGPEPKIVVESRAGPEPESAIASVFSGSRVTGRPSEMNVCFGSPLVQTRHSALGQSRTVADGGKPGPNQARLLSAPPPDEPIR